MISEDDVRAKLDSWLTSRRATAAGQAREHARAVRRGDDLTGAYAGLLPDAVTGYEPLGTGWLAWIADEPGNEKRAGAPGLRAMLFTEDDSTRVHSWPDLALDDIRARILAARPGDRFLPVVQAYLEVAGWHPGRRLPDTELDDWARHRPDLEGIELHPDARAALSEFGGLRIQARRYCDIQFFPHEVSDSRWREASGFADWGEAVAYPIALDHQQRTEGLIMLFADPPEIPAVVLDGAIDQYAVGTTVDDMLTGYLTNRRVEIVG